MVGLLLVWFGLPLLGVVVLIFSGVLDGGRPPKHRTVQHHYGESWTCACGTQISYMTDGTHESFLRIEEEIAKEMQEHIEHNDRSEVG